MTKNDLVALADALRIHNQTADGRTEFTPDHLLVLADFCASQEPNFNRKRVDRLHYRRGWTRQRVDLRRTGQYAHPRRYREGQTRRQGEPRSGPTLNVWPGPKSHREGRAPLLPSPIM
jgi:hypothetical protein